MRADKTRFPIRCVGMDVGSNALRLAIAEFKSPTRYKILERKRVSVRLGRSVFKSSRIDPATLDAAVGALPGFPPAVGEDGGGAPPAGGPPRPARGEKPA